ncbi:pilus assembly protein [Caballeronia sordidicola]|jgi:Flp pilus assembly protein TadD|uniref:Flp pilus assembly protein TadD containing TPR repeat n=1 Tax=Caballeronia sordidicola TaxID=196367 RepID=A0A226X5P8_CABSO|nr:Flp pilus assembly protein TadD containing TPR repeat [Caballeronia sordidicola]
MKLIAIENRLCTVVLMLACSVFAGLGGCASKMESGYGVGIQAEREAALQQSQQKQDAPDTPGMYLALIDRMQSQGLFYASLAHIDAYEKQYGPTPDTTLLRADALRQTGQAQGSAHAYTKLLNTPLAARGYRGLGLLAGAAGQFDKASEALDTATRLQPTDALTLSDLGYARLRLGDVAGARVPLMKAAELAQDNPKILSNVALFLLADGQAAAAQGLIAQQKFSPEVQQAIRADAQRIAAASTQATHARAAEVAAAATEHARVPMARAPETVDSLLNAQLPLTQTIDPSGAMSGKQPQLVAR